MAQFIRQHRQCVCRWCQAANFQDRFQWLLQQVSGTVRSTLPFLLARNVTCIWLSALISVPILCRFVDGFGCRVKIFQFCRGCGHA